MWATYEEWRGKGRFVNKGEKSVLRDPEGVALFSKEQTSKYVPRDFSPTYTGNRGPSGYRNQCSDEDYDERAIFDFNPQD